MFGHGSRLIRVKWKFEIIGVGEISQFLVIGGVALVLFLLLGKHHNDRLQAVFVGDFSDLNHYICTQGSYGTG